MNDIITPERPTQQSTAWHELDPGVIVQRLDCDFDGLSDIEAAERLTRVGPNQISDVPPPTRLSLLIRHLLNPLLGLLIVAACVTVALGGFIDAAVIALVIALDTVIGVTHERSAESSVRALAQLAAPHAHVIRGGRDEMIESRELVPGDLVLLESGARVPADIRLLSTTALLVDESLMTGESLTVVKDHRTLGPGVALADRRNMAYAGTTVTSGRGRGLVVATGVDTELGGIATQVRTSEREPTPLQYRLRHLARIITIVVVVAAIAIMAIGVVQGETISAMLTVAVATAVSAVPEGLPIAYTLTLAVGVRRMARRNAIVRRLPSVETLGSTNLIGSDKTGTLTENRMTVTHVWSAGTMLVLADTDGASDVPRPTPGSPLEWTLVAGVLTNEAELIHEADAVVSHGDPTEVALLVAAARMGIDPAAIRDAYPRVAETPFEPEHQYSAALCEHEGQSFLFIKGAPERVLGMCVARADTTGAVELEPQVIHENVRSLAAGGMRVMAMAYRPLVRPRDHRTDLSDPTGLTFLGLQGMLDPPRPEVRKAISDCQAAGIRVVMITGDHPDTARAIARDLGIAQSDAVVLTSRDLDQMDDATLAGRVNDVSVYARVAPEHKLRVVRALQQQGNVVAVTGDGVNDAPALHAADIGIAMGMGGTDVAREAADMVLADDNFASISAAVEEGRIIFDNIRKVTFFLVSTGVAEVMTIMAALLLRWPVPFLPAQIIWLNLVTNGLQDVALAFEPGDRDVLQRPPRRKQEPIISRRMWERTIVSGLVMSIGTLFIFQLARSGSDALVQAQSVALTTMVVFQAFHVGNARSETRSLLTMNPFSNRFLFIATLAAFAVHLAALYLPPTQYLLRVEPIPLSTWPMIVAVATTILLAVELHKLVCRRRDQPRAIDTGADDPHTSIWS